MIIVMKRIKYNCFDFIFVALCLTFSALSLGGGGNGADSGAVCCAAWGDKSLDSELCIDDLSFLLERLPHAAENHWYMLGVLLHIQITQLDRLEAQPESKLPEILKMWLEGCTIDFDGSEHKPTLRTFFLVVSTACELCVFAEENFKAFKENIFKNKPERMTRPSYLVSLYMKNYTAKFAVLVQDKGVHAVGDTLLCDHDIPFLALFISQEGGVSALNRFGHCLLRTGAGMGYIKVIMAQYRSQSAVILTKILKKWMDMQSERFLPDLGNIIVALGHVSGGQNPAAAGTLYSWLFKQGEECYAEHSAYTKKKLKK